MEPGQGPLLPTSPRTQPQDHRLAVPFQNGPRLKTATKVIHSGKVGDVVANNLHIVHIAKAPVPEASQPHPGEDRRQPPQEGLNVDDKQKGREGVPLADRKQDLQWTRDGVEQEGGGDVSMEGGDSPPEHAAKAHGGQNGV